MAYPEFLTTGWQDNVRALAGGASTATVSDTTLALDSYGPAAEDRIKDLVTDWSALKTTHAANFNRAAIRLVSAKVCDLIEAKVKQSERIGGEYQYSLQKVEWDRRKIELMNEFYYYLGLIDSDLTPEITHIDKIARDPAIYEEFEVVE